MNTMVYRIEATADKLTAPGRGTWEVFGRPVSLSNDFVITKDVHHWTDQLPRLRNVQDGRLRELEEGSRHVAHRSGQALHGPARWPARRPHGPPRWARFPVPSPIGHGLSLFES